MNRAKVDTERDERAKRESQIIIAAERVAREDKTARLRALRLAMQANESSATQGKTPPHRSSPKA
ncbi:MAG: hypothetical protein ABIQ51_25380 [Mesorhizobium sp.]